MFASADLLEQMASDVADRVLEPDQDQMLANLDDCVSEISLAGKNGAAVGWNRVEVRAVRKTGRMIGRGLGGTGEMIEDQTEGVAPRFNSESTLKCDVKPGENRANFEVNSK